MHSVQSRPEAQVQFSRVVQGSGRNLVCILYSVDCKLIKEPISVIFGAINTIATQIVAYMNELHGYVPISLERCY